MRVELSQQWRQRASDMGRGRQQYADSSGLNNFSNESAGESEHKIGCLGEIAVAALLRRPWGHQIGILGGIDVGGVVEVRTRRVPGTGSDLAFRLHDKDDKPHVLVCIDVHQNIDVIGWLYGWEMRGRAKSIQPIKSIYYISPPYRSVRSLVEQFSILPLSTTG